MNYVIGSGPSGIAAAAALLDRGEFVTMIDTGFVIEPEIEARVDRLRRSAPIGWSETDVDPLKASMRSDTNGIPLKLLFGSDFPYAGGSDFAPMEANAVGGRPSFARGGLSNVWGASVMPYAEHDLGRWPKESRALDSHYRATAKILGLRARRDDLAEVFPLYTTPDDSLPRSRQATEFLRDLGENRESLRKNGVTFGASRLAVLGGTTGCVACGMCMYGCPYRFIYHSSSTLEEFRKNPRFAYIGRIAVKTVCESGGEARIHAVNVDSGEDRVFNGDRVFIATGVYSTARIVLQSRGIPGEEIVLRDSQYFLFPMLRNRGIRGVSGENLHTLSQAYLEIMDREIDEHFIHLQVYTYNDLYRTALDGAFGPALRIFPGLVDRFLGRLLIFQGYLHSDVSGTITLKLGEAEGREGFRRILVTGNKNPETRRTIKRVISKLNGLRGSLCATAISPMLKIQDPGKGFHAGGSFPMSANPGNHETDSLGRIAGWDRIHIVDSSVLPSIPATTITFPTMANAHRIAFEAVAGRVAGGDE